MRQIAEDDSFGSFRSGDPAFAALKTFLRKQAKAYERVGLARTYVIEDNEAARVAAYLTLVSSEIRSENQLVQTDEAHFPYEQYPAVKIARLMVDERYRSKPDVEPFKLGRTLVDFALDVTRHQVCGWVGCRFLTVDSKPESLRFYEKCGFTLLDTTTNRARSEKLMFIDLSKL